MKRFLIGLFLALPVLSAAQSNFQRGYIVNNAKDTLEGYIDYKPQLNSITSFTFKPGENGVLQTMTVENCKAYGIKGYGNFERFTLAVSQGSASTEATVFLKVLLKGFNVTFYKYRDDLRERFFLKGNASADPYELIADNDRYKGQLLFEMRNYNSGTQYFESDMESVKYNEQDLSKVIAMMNREVVRVAKKNTRLFVGVGVSNTSPRYTGQHPLSSDAAVRTSSLMPSISVGADLFNGATAAFFVYRAELSLLMGKDLKIANGDMVHSFDHMTLSFNPKVLANVYNQEKLKVFFGVGAIANYSKFNNNKAGRVVPVSGSGDQFIETEVALNSASIAYNFSAGILINKKIEAGATYTPAYSVSNYNAFDVKLNILQVGLKYHFGK
ncbi:hypothetical protein ACXZ1K_07160 [Pedobacter sp. PWIIR3]